MRQLVLHGPRDLSVRERPPADLGPDEVRVTVAATGVCGSDVHGYTGANARRRPGTVMGHEIAGRVAEVGPGVKDLSVGEAVTIDPIVSCRACDLCRAGYDNLCAERRLYGCTPELEGGYADEVVVRAANVFRFGDRVPIAWGALAEPLAVGRHATLIADELGRLGRSAIIGGGPIGLSVALSVRTSGFPESVVVEPVAARREVAARMGVEARAPDDAALRAGTFDVVFDCAGFPATLDRALELTRPRGLVVFVGLAQETIPMNAERVEVGERRISGSAAYTLRDFAHATKLLASGLLDVEPMIEARVDLDGLGTAFAGYADGTLRAVKTLLEP